MSFVDHYTKIFYHGVETSPRGMDTKELTNISFTTPVGIIPTRPKDNPAIGIIEMFQLLAGRFDIDSIAAAAPNARLELFTEQSAYGPRIQPQLNRVLQTLIEDPDSRRAILTVTDKFDENQDLPCTNSIQFLVRENLLETIISMRSSDAVWGLPYDIIQFSGLALAVGKVIGKYPTNLHFQLGSAHIYNETAMEPWRWKTQPLNWTNRGGTHPKIPDSPIDLNSMYNFGMIENYANWIIDQCFTGPELVRSFLRGNRRGN